MKQSRQTPLKFVHWRFFHEMKKGYSETEQKLRRSPIRANFISRSVRFSGVPPFHVSACSSISKAATKTLRYSEMTEAQVNQKSDWSRLGVLRQYRRNIYTSYLLQIHIFFYVNLYINMSTYGLKWWINTINLLNIVYISKVITLNNL